MIAIYLFQHNEHKIENENPLISMFKYLDYFVKSENQPNF